MTPPTLRSYLSPLPLIAVLRGISPPEIPSIAAALTDNGFRILEVPLNSPDPFASIKMLADTLGDRCLTGAGTVLKVADVARVAEAGGRLIVMPHADVAIIREAKRLGLVCAPGVATMTEAFAALDAGADGLKMFPAELLSPAVLKAWRAVLPRTYSCLPSAASAQTTWRRTGRRARTASAADRICTNPGASADEVRAVAGAYAAGFAALEAQLMAQRAFDLVALGEPLLEFNQVTARRRDRLSPGIRRRYLELRDRRGAPWRERPHTSPALGDDAFGRMFLDLWRREGVDVSGVGIDADAPTGIYFVTHGARGHEFSYLRAGSAAAAHAAWRLAAAN